MTERTNRQQNQAFELPTRQDYEHLPRHPLIICATLVQNPANLGALCRTAEGFCVESLVISDLAIAQTQDFKNLAVSTQRWQPIRCCNVESLPNWIAAQRQAGYTVVALQQTPAAIPLHQFSYPDRCVLVLGRELTGIPETIVQECDRAVVIPQFGLVESFNVQTAAAIAIYEYIRQQL